MAGVAGDGELIGNGRGSRGWSSYLVMAWVAGDGRANW